MATAVWWRILPTPPLRFAFAERTVAGLYVPYIQIFKVVSLGVESMWLWLTWYPKRLCSIQVVFIALDRCINTTRLSSVHGGMQRKVNYSEQVFMHVSTPTSSGIGIQKLCPASVLAHISSLAEFISWWTATAIGWWKRLPTTPIRFPSTEWSVGGLQVAYLRAMIQSGDSNMNQCGFEM